MAEHGIHDFGLAKRKAAVRHDVSEGAALPSNTEIEQALQEYQRLFTGSRHDERLRIQRSAALKAMEFLADYRPRLVGPVLSGTATDHADVQLHLFAERPENVTLRLMEHRIEHEVTEKRLRLDAERVRNFPGIRFELERQMIDATVFPIDGERQAPTSPVDGRPMRRADADELRELLEA